MSADPWMGYYPRHEGSAPTPVAFSMDLMVAAARFLDPHRDVEAPAPPADDLAPPLAEAPLAGSVDDLRAAVVELTEQLRATPPSAPLPVPVASQPGAPTEPEKSEPLCPRVPTLLSTKAASRHLRVRPERLFALAQRAVADGVAEPVGDGKSRRHVRWRRDQLDSWWRSQSR